MFNLKLALRTLVRSPFVTIVAALSLALGIGANTAIFSLFDEMLRRPLPVHQPERLVNLSAPGVMSGSNSCNQSGNCDEVWSYPMFKDLEKSPGQFSGVAAYRIFGVNVAYEGQTPLNAEGAMVSGQYFSVLGLQPVMGRLIGPGDDEIIGANFVAVLSYAFWETKLGFDRTVIGKSILVNGQRMTIIGVGPKDFDGTTLGSKPQVFVPITMRGLMNPGFNGFENRRNYWTYLFARLKPGATIDQATAAINAVYKPILLNVEVPLQKGNGMSDQTLERFKKKEVKVVDGRRGQSSVHREAGTPIFLLFAITGIVLLTACANIANLLLARAANRTTEMAVRLSLGATRRQLLTQLLTESIVLAALGGVFSLLFAYWTLNGIAALLPDEVTSTISFKLSWLSVYFAAATAVATGVVFGLFPALQSTRPDLVTALRNAAGKLSGGRAAARFRTSLATAQIALSMALLISAGLFLKSLANVSRVDLGLKVDNVVMFTVSPVRNGYDSTRTKAFFGRLAEELAALPAANSVTSGVIPLMAGNNTNNSYRVQGFQRGPDTDASSRVNWIGPDYFKTLGIKLLAGREFTTADDKGRPLVAVVNEAFVKKFGMPRDVVGMRLSENDTGPLDVEIVGLAQNAKYSEVKDTIPPQVFFPYRQVNIGRNSFYVRTSGDALQMLRQIPGAVKRLDPNLPVEELKTLPQQVKERVFLDRMISTLTASFALLATMLAAVGLYGVLAYSVAQRTREIGVRMALGADSGRVRGMVLRQVSVMVAVGGTIGVAGALALGRGARSLLFEIKGYDPVVLSASVVLLGLIALAAGYIPALRASKIDPMQALRYE
ncbi:MAG TPA: ABC transporter permease [Gemmatimonadaceae bacterium]|nr:ABC transporter permease [Gemmatimonadaceae bacterium]